MGFLREEKEDRINFIAALRNELCISEWFEGLLREPRSKVNYTTSRMEYGLATYSYSYFLLN